MLGHGIAYMHAKFDHLTSTFSRSGDMVGAHKNLTDILTTTPAGIVCHVWTSTCYDQPIYQI